MQRRDGQHRLQECAYHRYSKQPSFDAKTSNRAKIRCRHAVDGMIMVESKCVVSQGRSEQVSGRVSGDGKVGPAAQHAPLATVKLEATQFASIGSGPAEKMWCRPRTEYQHGSLLGKNEKTGNEQLSLRFRARRQLQVAPA